MPVLLVSVFQRTERTFPPVWWEKQESPSVTDEWKADQGIGGTFGQEITYAYISGDCGFYCKSSLIGSVSIEYYASESLTDL